VVLRNNHPDSDEPIGQSRHPGNTSAMLPWTPGQAAPSQRLDNFGHRDRHFQQLAAPAAPRTLSPT
jgi:hypothetical protein